MSQEQPPQLPGSANTPEDEQNVHTAIEIAVRLGVLAVLAALCLRILAPFVGIVLWALIIAVASDDLFRRLVSWVGGRRGLAAGLFVIAAFTVVIVPSVLLSETLIAGSQHFASEIASGRISIPEPPQKVASVPLIGERLYDAWLLASENLGAALARLKPQLETISRWLLRAAGSAGVALLQLAASIVLAGVLLTRSKDRSAAIARLATRLAGPRGPEFAELAQATVRSVVQGILGVAVFQAMAAGLAFMVAGVPAAGLWALLVLVAAIMQIPVALVMLPPIFLVYSASSTGVAVAFAVWCIAVSLADNVLKPILFGRGVEVPMIVIFLGAVGGMLSMGIIGLFLGAVILALGYELFVAWLDTDRRPDDAEAVSSG